MATINKGNRKDILIEDKAGDFVLTPPGEINLTISIDELKFKKDYVVRINYLEKKKFNFKIE
jgi:hypothetical protein